MLGLATRAGLRLYSSSPQRPPLKLVAELRKLTEVSITKAREALSASNNEINASLEWLQKDLVASGTKRAAKVEGRMAGQGLISVSVLSTGTGGSGNGGLRAAMLELNCETDFVGRNELFGNLAADISHTAAFMSDPVDSGKLLNPFSMDVLLESPLISRLNPQSPPSSTVGNSIHDMIAKVGEKISLRRVVKVVQDPISQIQRDIGFRLASYVHGTVHLPFQGRIGALAVLALRSPQLSGLLASASFRDDLGRLERSLARQIVGFDTRLVRSPAGAKDENALYEQPFMMFPGESSGEPVQSVLCSWARQRGLVGEDDATGGLEVVEFAKWTVGQSLDVSPHSHH
jgi:elongation factor Ts